MAKRPLTTVEKAIVRAQLKRDRLEIETVERVMKAMRLPSRAEKRRPRRRHAR